MEKDNELRIEDLAVGDVVYVRRAIRHGFNCIGHCYKKITVKRITPKKTKLVDTEDTAYNKDQTFYRTMTLEMDAATRRTFDRVAICNCELKLDKLQKEGIRNLSGEETASLGKACKEVNRILDRILNNRQNK